MSDMMMWCNYRHHGAKKYWIYYFLCHYNFTIFLWSQLSVFKCRKDLEYILWSRIYKCYLKYFCPHCVLARGAGMQSPNNSKKFAFNRWRCPMQIIAWGWQSILFCSNINDNARNPFFNASTLIFFNDFLIWLGECNACQHTLQCIIYYSHSLYAT